ncbi:choline binding protein E CbpE [Streptococcus pneumoniae]|nr:choline binding protein E CbpE [Streptococcus pneumoniae]
MKKKLTSLALVGAFLGLSWYGNVQAQESSGNKIHFINVQEGGSDAIILESNGHFAMVDTGEDYDFPDGSDSRYPWREGIETSYKHVLTDRVFRRLKELSVQKLDFILVTHTHSDHIGMLMNYCLPIQLTESILRNIVIVVLLILNVYGIICMAMIRFYRLLQKKVFQLFKISHKGMLIFSLGTWIFSSIIMKMKLIHRVN